MLTLEQPRLDIEAVKLQVSWLNNKELMRFSEQRHMRHTVASQLDYIKSFLDHPENILREIHDEGRMVGTITAYIDKHNRVANVGILIGGEHQAKGYGYSSWSMLCDLLFDNVGMRRIEGGCMAAHEAMIRVFRRYGMREEGRRMSHFAYNGSYSDLVLYGRFR